MCTSCVYLHTCVRAWIKVSLDIFLHSALKRHSIRSNCLAIMPVSTVTRRSIAFAPTTLYVSNIMCQSLGASHYVLITIFNAHTCTHSKRILELANTTFYESNDGAVICAGYTHKRQRNSPPNLYRIDYATSTHVPRTTSHTPHLTSDNHRPPHTPHTPNSPKTNNSLSWEIVLGQYNHNSTIILQARVSVSFRTHAKAFQQRADTASFLPQIACINDVTVTRHSAALDHTTTSTDAPQHPQLHSHERNTASHAQSGHSISWRPAPPTHMSDADRSAVSPTRRGMLTRFPSHLQSEIVEELTQLMSSLVQLTGICYRSSLPNGEFRCSLI